ncbi:hypothetical protein E3Q22_04208 [Wallemia mellicola]|uniref:BSD domain-containing protein n=2 Tax=Wallemia mellicola TaxID=1708541 RepID=A0A4T0LWR2_9BASI|nr:hypothetical protein WALSEDRAFT_70688 [Wallemia mellicola CBS 633.66]TIB70392.1 hypothetical protein E3Q23_04205 [Wallemia mellicola]EIM19347.1 hypothetical protein WALSEDRAFT_70688 [Wallemia mellicola CBS 633.66]TIB74336.1 hypothetical protein E3Q22_04208 [Wallemia mellicola]TIB79359.1 hypothetical protein E3Q21_04153 [Wallemia mellicola]TIB83477.1 hypothetical protein E3Q20_04134 [Wallemia mellicola]|eukprot:XP_006960623.1 hypothetical protein WALSEDRAFT_70688 [Wallemia mellicola CBS 633.66]
MEIKVSYKKQSGNLNLLDDRLEFSSQNSFNLNYSRLLTLFASKQGSTPVRLKLDLSDPQQSITFTFIHPTHALSQREHVKDRLSNAIASNRASSSRQVESQLTSTTPTTRSSTPGLGLSKDDLEIRKKVLIKDPQLAKLHKDLVIAGIIDENEFWQGRQQLLLLEHLSQSQKPGKSSTLVDPRPTSSQPGEFTITITPQLVHDIFQEYPVVQKAYVENVPNPLNDNDFWIRYFHSHLFARHRASSRQDANEARNDPIFDQYLEEADDGVEPKHKQRGVYDKLIDLGSTQEDHKETGNALDITMQAGKVKAALPLMRRFNEHSMRLLSTTVGDEEGAHDNDYNNQITIDDLQEHQLPQPIRLNMQNSEQYYTSNIVTTGDYQQSSQLDSKTIWDDIKNNLDEWDVVITLEDIKDTKDAQTEVEKILSANAEIAYNDINSNEISNSDIMKAAINCHTAATEFLRLYWTTVLSYPIDIPKVNKMIDYINKTPQKVDAIVRSASAMNQGDLIRQALQPVMNGVTKVKEYERNRAN